MAQRYDTTQIRKFDTTSQGFLKVPARLTRIGILEYRDASGAVTREFRSPEEVFAADSLASLAGNPVTDLHPDTFVTAENARALSVGFAGDSPRHDSRFVESDLRIHDASTIRAIQEGSRREISCGYTCDVVRTPGVYKGEKYDAVQRNIRYNHIALLPPGQGRAGSEVAIRLDSSSAICELPVDGTDYNEKPLMNEEEIKKLQERADAAEARIKSLESDLGKSAAEAESLRKALDTYQEAERKDARDALETQARSVLGADVKFDGKSDREVQEMVLAKVQPERKLDSVSDEYVAGAFEYVLTAQPVKPRSVHQVRELAHNDSNVKTLAQVRADAIAKRNSAWRGDK